MFNQDKVIFTHKQVMNVCTVCKINLRPSTVGQYFMLGNSLSGAIKFTKNTTDVDKYNYSGDGI